MNIDYHYDRDQIEKQRKRIFFFFCSVLAGIAFALLTVVDIVEHDILETVIDISVLTVFGVSAVLLKTGTHDRTAYRIAFLGISIAIYSCIYIGAGMGTALYWVYLQPVLVFFFFGRREGLCWIVPFYILVGVAILAARMSGSYVYDADEVTRFYLTSFIISTISYGVEASRHYYSELLEQKSAALETGKRKLEQAMSEIKTLSGLIPICSACKKVRDDTGYWHQVEGYLQKHTSADFTHGICPECFGKLYPSLQDDV